MAFFKNGVFVDVDFPEDRAKFAEQGRDGSLGFFAKMTAGTRIECDVPRAACREPRVFR
jgi:hypothetical protein